MLRQEVVLSTKLTAVAVRAMLTVLWDVIHLFDWGKSFRQAVSNHRASMADNFTPLVNEVMLSSR